MWLSARRKSLLEGASVGAMMALIALPAASQAVGEADTAQRETVTVFGERLNSYRVDQPSLSKLTEPLVETPQSITVLSSELLTDRAVATLNDALRNVPGISLGAGEFSWQGTNLTLRGFSARNDLYLDGMRDFGSYYRDPFALEQVEVLEGPSSMLFGRGSTGGVVNQVSKTPVLRSVLESTLTFGTDSTKRFTADINQPLPEFGEGTAVRLAVMGHDSQVAGRDVAENQRYGFAPSLALGLGTPTRLTLGYFHLSENDIPDYGIPWFAGRPAPVARNNFYGFKSDWLSTDADVMTARLEHDFSDAVTIRDQVRYANYHRGFRITEPVVAAGTPVTAPLSIIRVTRNEFSGNSRETMLQNQTDATIKFTTGDIGHTVVAGFEVGSERSSPLFNNSTNVAQNSLIAPDENQIFGGTTYPRFRSNTEASSLGVYAMDTLKFGESWDLTAGIRWDQFKSNFTSVGYSVPPSSLGTIVGSTTADRVDQMPSYRFALVYKPMSNASIYADYGTSFNPSSEMLTQIINARAFGTGNRFLSPEKNRTYEMGAKWDVLDAKLSLRAALFRAEKLNARVPDPNNPGFNVLGGDQKVDGFDIEASGRLTDRWQVNTGYTYLHSRVVTSAPGAAAVGIALANVPKHSFTLWSAYNVTDQVEIGGGVNYVSHRLGQNTVPVEIASGYTTFDAMANYQVSDQVKLQVNLYNLADRYYYDQLHPFHIVPGAGRSALFTLAFKY